MTFHRRFAAALAAACLCASPALAETSSFALGGGWQKIAASGASILLSASGAGVFSTAAAGSSPTLQAGFAVPAPICLALTADLYAIGSGSATVTTGVTCASSGGGSGGGGSGGSTIANQGTAGSSPWPVLQGGSTGTDASANGAAVPMSGFVLLATAPAAASRAFVEVQNQSAGTLQVVRDDGAGNNLTSILLGSGGGAGTQGAGWSSATFKGRVRVYGATGAQVSVYQD